jgi:hypothetical protein
MPKQCGVQLSTFWVQLKLASSSTSAGLMFVQAFREGPLLFALAFFSEQSFFPELLI